MIEVYTDTDTDLKPSIFIGFWNLIHFPLIVFNELEGCLGWQRIDPNKYFAKCPMCKHPEGTGCYVR